MISNKDSDAQLAPQSLDGRPGANCRFCSHPLRYVVVDLANSPPSNSFLTSRQLNEPEVFYPLKVFVCEGCWLVQIDELKKHRDIFDGQYAYFSSYSSTWLAHARHYVEDVIQRFGVDIAWQVMELASNDGYLLQYFKERAIPVLGIEPAANVARAAQEKGIETVIDFFGTSLARQLVQEGRKANLLIGNNVLAHVPNINDFVHGLKLVLADKGIITMEFPHLMRLIEQNQFDTIYHEHFSYLSLHSTSAIFENHSLQIFKARHPSIISVGLEEIPTLSSEICLRMLCGYPQCGLYASVVTEHGKPRVPGGSPVEANRRYQQSERGKQSDRQRRYRERQVQACVTDWRNDQLRRSPTLCLLDLRSVRWTDPSADPTRDRLA